MMLSEYPANKVDPLADQAKQVQCGVRPLLLDSLKDSGCKVATTTLLSKSQILISLSVAAEPVSVRGEAQGMDDSSSLKRVKALALIQVPKHGSSVLSSRGTKGAIWGNTDSVEVSSVSDKVVTEGKGVTHPNLDETIPSTGDNKWYLNRRAESYAGNPLGVTLSLSTEGELALSKGVPELDGLISGSRDDLTVVKGEGNRKNILLVTDKSSGGLSRTDLPKSQGSIPRSRKSKLSIRRYNRAHNWFAVSREKTSSVSWILIFWCELPNHQLLITRG